MFKGVYHFDMNESEEDLGPLRMVFTAWGATIWFDIPDFAHWLADRDMSEIYAFHPARCRTTRISGKAAGRDSGC